MSSAPARTDLARPFMPTKDFDLSKRFYEALGFEKVLDGEVAIFRAGSGGFILQRHYQADWAGNFMMHLMVKNADVWWQHIQDKKIPEKYPGIMAKPPAMQPWGLRVLYLSDPSGVLWHIADKPQT